MQFVDTSNQEGLIAPEVPLSPENTKAVSQLMKLWETRQTSKARGAAKGAGLTLMAVSLAACGGSNNSNNTGESLVGQGETTPVTPPEDGTVGLPEGFVPFVSAPISGAEIEQALALFPGLVGFFPGFGGDGGNEVHFTINALGLNEFEVDLEIDPDDYTDNRTNTAFNGLPGETSSLGSDAEPDGGNGLTALELAAGTEETYDAIKIVSAGNGTQNSIFGGSGGNGAPGENGEGGIGGNGGNGGHAIDNGAISTIKIVGDTLLEIIGGVGGNGGRGGDGFSVPLNNDGNSNPLTSGNGGHGGDAGAGGAGLASGGNGGDGGSVSVNNNNSGPLTAGNGGDGGKGGGNGGNGGTASAGNNNSGALTGGNGGDGGEGGGNGGNGGIAEADDDNSGALTGGNGGDGVFGGDAGFSSFGVNNSGTLTNGAPGDSRPSPIESDAIIAAFSQRVDVDASEFQAFLRISGSDFDDTFIAGDFGSRFFATKGSDIYTFGDGIDTYVITALDQSNGTDALDRIIDFDFDEDEIGLSAFADYLDPNSSYSNTGDLFEVDVTGNGDPDIVIEIVGLGVWVTGGGDLSDLVAPF